MIVSMKSVTDNIETLEKQKKKEKLDANYVLDKIVTIVLLVLFVGGQLCLLAFSRDVRWLFGAKNLSGLLNFWEFMGLSLLLTLTYFWVYIMRQRRVANYLWKECDPNKYNSRYGALTLKANKFVCKQNEISCSFLTGDWEKTRTLSFNALLHSKNIELVQNAFAVMMQIYAIEGDNANLEALYKSLTTIKVPEKKTQIFASLIESASMYLDYLNGNCDKMILRYNDLKNNCKHKSDKYIAEFYYGLANMRGGRPDIAVESFGMVMNGANKLFVADLSKKLLLSLISS